MKMQELIVGNLNEVAEYINNAKTSEEILNAPLSLLFKSSKVTNGVFKDGVPTDSNELITIIYWQEYVIYLSAAILSGYLEFKDSLDNYKAELQRFVDDSVGSIKNKTISESMGQLH